MPTAVTVTVAFGGLAWPSAVAVVDGDVRLCVREVAVVAVTVIRWQRLGWRCSLLLITPSSRCTGPNGSLYRWRERS